MALATSDSTRPSRSSFPGPSLLVSDRAATIIQEVLLIRNYKEWLGIPKSSFEIPSELENS